MQVKGRSSLGPSPLYKCAPLFQSNQLWDSLLFIALVALRRHPPCLVGMTEILGRKEARSLTDSPYWNLSDNDFVFASCAHPGVQRTCFMGSAF